MLIRPAVKEDLSAIMRLIHDLAEYEKAPDEVETNEVEIGAALFASDPKVFCSVADHEGEVIGIAIWFLNFSTWQGKHGIYLEDLFIKPEYRDQGYGLAMLKHLAAICNERGYGRFQLGGLDWNTPAIEFYKSQGAIAMDEWTVYRVSGENLKRLGS
jgi:GNAT superfamily N-acetyltransferase